MTMLKSVVGALAAVILTISLAAGALAQTPSPQGASVYFIEPADGAEIEGPVKVTFGLAGMGVAPAGVDKPDTGHHHLLIDAQLDDFTSTIPKDAQHVHFGGGQTQTIIQLPPGKHTLQLILGDRNHMPHVPPVKSELITIFIK